MRHRLLSTAATLAFFLLPLSGGFDIKAQTAEKPLRAVTDPGVITTRQGITPAGVQTVFAGRVYGVSFGEDENEVWVVNPGAITKLDWRQNRVIKTYPLESRSGLQGLAYDRLGHRLFTAGAMHKKFGEPRKVRLWKADDTAVQTWGEPAGSHIGGALAIAAERNAQGERIVVLPLIFDNAVAVFDVERGRLLAKIKTGIAPFGAALDSRGTVAYVTNWGGRVPLPGDETLPAGLDPNADRVVVDERGIASTGVVNRIDLTAGKVTHTIPVGLHPTAILWDIDRHRLYVANGNKDSISVIDSRLNRVIDSFILQPFAQSVFGIAPTALALSADGRTLYVACGGINAVAVLDALHGRIEGLIPTGWYPNGLVLSPGGGSLAVSTLLGVGSGSRDEARKRFVHAYRGSVSIIPIPDSAQLASYTTVVGENNRLPLQPSKVPMSGVPPATTVAIPRRSGDRSFIEHVVYIIKENRTYDQLLGDIAKGNGDPTLVMFGEGVTPNQHCLADQFVLLDNLYATGGNSGDGHQWLTQANETDYSMWPGSIGRSYPFDGTDPIAYSAAGFIWDAALRMKKTVRVYGEFAGRMEGPPELRARLLGRWRNGEDFTQEWKIEAPLSPLNRILAHNYPPFNMVIPDVVRAQIFLADLKKWESEGQMPNLVIMLLPSDHTFGTRPLVSSPKAMVADNDLALGRIVEALSRSRFWKKMAIFVVEDDAQDGVDHVDGHRTVALAVSPYVRRGHVDSTFYAQPSILKTIELILGLPTLSLFDLIANDMRASFVDTPDFTPYQSVVPKQSLDEMNPPAKALGGAARRAALASARMRFDVPDAAPSEELNRILWHEAKGWHVPYPQLRQAVFAPMALDLDDDDRVRQNPQGQRRRVK